MLPTFHHTEMERAPYPLKVTTISYFRNEFAPEGRFKDEGCVCLDEGKSCEVGVAPNSTEKHKKNRSDPKVTLKWLRQTDPKVT